MELSDIFRTLAVLLMAVIWGGMIVVDFVVTPARFRLDREIANTLGANIFRSFGWVQMGTGIVAVVAVIASGLGIEGILASLFILVFIALQVGFIEPSMTKLRKLSPEESAENESTRQQLHRAYVGADLFKLLLGVILFGLLVIQ